jgi:hypothetical protein
MEVDTEGSSSTGDIFCFDENSLSLQQRDAGVTAPTNNPDATAPLSNAKYVCVPYAGLVVKMQDFTEAIKCIQPTAKREGFAVAPDVTWADVGALAEVIFYSIFFSVPFEASILLNNVVMFSRYGKSCYIMC